MKPTFTTSHFLASLFLFSAATHAAPNPGYSATSPELEGHYVSNQGEQLTADIAHGNIFIDQFVLSLENSEAGVVIFSTGSLAGDCHSPGCSVLREVSGEIYAYAQDSAVTPRLKVLLTREFLHPEYEGDKEGLETTVVYLDLGEWDDSVKLDCRGSSGASATLEFQIGRRTGVWQSGSLKSNLTLRGTERAPYSDRLGYSVYSLDHFAPGNDFSRNLAVDEEALSLGGVVVKVVTYLDNDGHDEEEVSYACTEVAR